MTIRLLPRFREVGDCVKLCRKGLHDVDLSDGRDSDGKCRGCRRLRDGSRREKRRDYQKNFRLSHDYGIDREFYDSLVKRQNEVCAICKEPESTISHWGEAQSLAVDHDHVTGKVRGLLCTNCNQGLGRFKDDVIRLEAAIKYLKEGGEI